MDFASEGLDWLAGSIAINSTAEALDRNHDTAPEALDRLTATTAPNFTADALDRSDRNVTSTSEALDRLDRPGGALRSSLALRCLRPPGRVELLTAPCGSRLPAVADRGPRRSRWSRLAVAVRNRGLGRFAPFGLAGLALRVRQAQHRDRASFLPSRLVRRSRCSRLTRPSHGARWRATRRSSSPASERAPRVLPRLAL
jgi:hypothetical protein